MGTEWNDNSLTNARAVSERFDHVEKMKRIEFEEKERKAMQDKENHDNLDSLVRYSDEAVKNLRELNEALKKNNELLEEKNRNLESSLNNIHEVLQDIFTVDCQTSGIQQERSEQINVLIGQILESLNRGEKVNWREKFIDVGSEVGIAAIGAVLKINGII